MNAGCNSSKSSTKKYTVIWVFRPKLLAKYIKQGIVTGPHIGKWAEIGSVRRLLEAIIWVDFTEEQPLLCQQTGVCRPIWSNKEPGDKGQERGQGTPELDEATHTLERLRRLENGGSKIPRCAWSSGCRRPPSRWWHGAYSARLQRWDGSSYLRSCKDWHRIHPPH